MGIRNQPDPIPNTQKPVWDLVIEDMRERDHIGREKYRTPLQPFNGRDFLVDAYQEALDLSVYLRGAMVELKALKEEIVRLSQTIEQRDIVLQACRKTSNKLLEEKRSLQQKVSLYIRNFGDIVG